MRRHLIVFIAALCLPQATEASPEITAKPAPPARRGAADV